MFINCFNQIQKIFFRKVAFHSIDDYINPLNIVYVFSQLRKLGTRENMVNRSILAELQKSSGIDAAIILFFKFALQIVRESGIAQRRSRNAFKKTIITSFVSVLSIAFHKRSITANDAKTCFQSLASHFVFAFRENRRTDFTGNSVFTRRIFSAFHTKVLHLPAFTRSFAVFCSSCIAAFFTRRPNAAFLSFIFIKFRNWFYFAAGRTKSFFHIFASYVNFSKSRELETVHRAADLFTLRLLYSSTPDRNRTQKITADGRVFRCEGVSSTDMNFRFREIKCQTKQQSGNSLSKRNQGTQKHYENFNIYIDARNQRFRADVPGDGNRSFGRRYDFDSARRRKFR